jgi:hypothetical protein
MFNWFRKRPPEQPAPEEHPRFRNPGQIAFAKGTHTWTEDYDVVVALASLLEEAGHRVVRDGPALRMEGPGYRLIPELRGFQPLDEGGSSTMTTIQVSHPELFPHGVFEYQHARGNTVQESVLAGMRGWLESDLPVFLDLLKESPENCTVVEMTLPPTSERGELKRRVLLGPVGYHAEGLANAEDWKPGGEEHPPFCACCLFSNTAEALQPQIESDAFVAIRFFGMRHGEIGADCRINGHDFEPGKEAIRVYVATWPQRGFEFRKQFAVIHTRT